MLVWMMPAGRTVFCFFQAEDGIRDHCETGVQTCALPIWMRGHDVTEELDERLAGVARHGLADDRACARVQRRIQRQGAVAVVLEPMPARPAPATAAARDRGGRAPESPSSHPRRP